MHTRGLYGLKMSQCSEKTSVTFLTKPEKDLCKRTEWVRIDLSRNTGFRQPLCVQIVPEHWKETRFCVIGKCQ